VSKIIIIKKDAAFISGIYVGSCRLKRLSISALYHTVYHVSSAHFFTSSCCWINNILVADSKQHGITCQWMAKCQSAI